MLWIWWRGTVRRAGLDPLVADGTPGSRLSAGATRLLERAIGGGAFVRVRPWSRRARTGTGRRRLGDGSWEALIEVDDSLRKDDWLARAGAGGRGGGAPGEGT